MSVGAVVSAFVVIPISSGTSRWWKQLRAQYRSCSGGCSGTLVVGVVAEVVVAVAVVVAAAVTQPKGGRAEYHKADLEVSVGVSAPYR